MMLEVKGENFIKNFFQATKKEILAKDIEEIKKRIKNLAIKKTREIVEEKLNGNWWEIDKVTKELYEFLPVYEMSRETGFFRNFNYIKESFILDNIEEILKNLELKKEIITKKEVKKYYSYIIQEMIMKNISNIKVYVDNEEDIFYKQDFAIEFMAGRKIIMATTVTKNSRIKIDDLVYKKKKQNSKVEHDWKIFNKMRLDIKKNALCLISTEEILKRRRFYYLENKKEIYLDLQFLVPELELFKLKKSRW